MNQSYYCGAKFLALLKPRQQVLKLISSQKATNQMVRFKEPTAETNLSLDVFKGKGLGRRHVYYLSRHKVLARKLY
jgi:hypothetical protein